MRFILVLFIVLISITSSACVYRMDIDQGNRIDAEKINQLATGMTRTQVEFLLGSAAINDPLHADKAHYVYYLHHGDTQEIEQKTMVLTYDNDILVDIEGAL